MFLFGKCDSLDQALSIILIPTSLFRIQDNAMSDIYKMKQRDPAVLKTRFGQQDFSQFPYIQSRNDSIILFVVKIFLHLFDEKYSLPS